MKITQPKAYKGQDSIDIFNEWVNQMLCWFRIYKVTGPDRDVDRVTYTGACLEDLAAQWFDQEVEGPDQVIPNWTFEDLICALFVHFIHEVSMQNAAEKYDKTRYSSERGALMFYNDIKCHAARMVQPPNEYSIRRKFINGLPMSIVEGVVKSRGISAEHSPMEQILVEVQRMESVLKMINNHSWAQQAKSLHADNHAKEGSSSGNSDGRNKYFHRGNVLYRKALSNARQQQEDGQWPQGNRDTGHTSSNNKGKGKATMLSKKDTGCFTCGENGHFTDRCPKPKKQNKARLFTAEVQDTDADGEQDEQGDAAQDIDKPGLSLSSDDNEDQVNGPQYLSDDEDIVEIYNNDDSDGEPVACLGRMSTHDPSDEEVMCYSYMSIAESNSDEFSEFEGDDEHKDSLNEYEVHCAVLETGDLGSHEQSCNGDISITDLLKVPALGQELEHFNAPQEMAEEVTAEGISSWGVINAMEKFMMPEINASPRWDWSDRFGFTHHSECQPCHL